jgi:cytochrome c biogenesis protein CcmG/thiol:disulfide interchange protein DsbE
MSRTPRSSFQMLLMLILPLGGIAAAVLIIISANSSPKTNDSQSIAAFPTPPVVTFIPPTPLPTAPPTPQPPQQSMLDKPVPDVTLTTLDGSSIRLNDLQGQIIFLNFWATWCTPCWEEMPALQTLQSQHGADGVSVIAVTDPTSGQTEDDIRQFVDGYHLSLTVALSSDPAFYQQFGVVQIPMTFVIDRNGIVRFRQVGALTTDDITVYLDRLTG